MTTTWSPDFIGIGAMKAATYWLYTCLEAHPEICMSSKKEVHFFNVPTNYRKGIKWYESFFSNCDEMTKRGEITPVYLSTPGVARLIHQHYPHVKLIASLRHPVDRAYSHYRFNVIRKGHMTVYDSFEDALNQEEELVAEGMYSKQLKEYYDAFPRKNIKIILYDDIQSDPGAVIRDLFTFLEVDNTFAHESATEKRGVTGKKKMEYKLPLVNPIMYYMRGRIRGGVLDKALTATGLKKRLLTLAQKNRRLVEVTADDRSTRFPPLTDDIYAKLTPIFAKDIKELELILGRDLQSWLD